MTSDAGEVVCADERACISRVRAGRRRGTGTIVPLVSETIDSDEWDALEWVAVAARAVWGQPTNHGLLRELGDALTELGRVRQVPL